MKKILYFAVVFVLLVASVTFAVLYFSQEADTPLYQLRGGGKLWLLAGKDRIFDATERAFQLPGVFGFPEGPAKWMPVGIPPSPFKPVVVAGDVPTDVADDEQVICVVSPGGTTAYPLRVLAFHQVVFDGTCDPAVMVYFGDHSHTAVAFAAGAPGRATQLASTGFLYKNIDLLYDTATESLFLPTAGVFVAGPRLGEQLEVLPSAVMSLGEWKKLRPATRIMTTNTGVKSARYKREDVLANKPAFKVKFTGALSPSYDAAEPVIAVGHGWYTSVIPFAAAKSAGKPEVAFQAGGGHYVARFNVDFTSAYVTDDTGAFLPSVRSTYRPYMSVMREAVVIQPR